MAQKRKKLRDKRGKVVGATTASGGTNPINMSNLYVPKKERMGYKLNKEAEKYGGSFPMKPGALKGSGMDPRNQ